MSNPLILKLDHGARLTDEDREALRRASARTYEVGPKTDLIGEGDRPDDVHLVMAGFACRYKVLENGKRQIMALLVPGDFCDFHVAILGEMDHAIATLSACTIVDIPRATILELTRQSPRISHAFWWATLCDEAVLREWLVSMGLRAADQQFAHLLCELLVRLQAVGLADQDSYDLPITQEELGDVLGLSTVHVNRTIQHMREEGIIVLKGRRLTILDPDHLKRLAGFRPNYLHLERRGRSEPEEAT